MNIRKYTILSLAAAMLAQCVVSCKKYPDPPSIFEEEEVLPVKPPRKVLLIAVDGVSGAEMKTIMPPSIASVLPHSKYSWDAISDVVTTNASTWKTLMSGVSSSKHRVLGYDNTFSIVVPDGGAVEGQYIPKYSSLFAYILTTPQSDMSTALVTTWPALINGAAPEVTNSYPVSGDAVVKDSTISLLKNKNNDIIIANFSDPSKAGVNFGFSNTVPGYKAAVMKTDEYIGQILNALKKERANYSKENWLVIIAGMHGGINKTFGGSTDAEKRTFTIYHNDLFKKNEFSSEGVFTGVTISGNGSSGAPLIKAQLNKANDFNIGPLGKQMTVQFNFRSSTSFSRPVFMSKQSKAFDVLGWSMYTNDNGIWCMTIGGTDRERRSEAGKTNIFDGAWHNLCFSVYDSIGRHWIKRLIDGKRIPDSDRFKELFGDATNAEPLVFGWGAAKGDGTIGFAFSDLAVYNTALTDEEIINRMCSAGSKLTSLPKYSNLVGLIPGNNGSDNVMYNQIDNTKNFLLTGPFEWKSMSPPCTYPTVTAGEVIPRQFYNTDISSQILYWLRIPNWRKEGSVWLKEYDVEFVQ